MVFEESENREQESTYHGADPIYRQRYEASYDEDLAAEFYFDEFNEMRSFDNIFSTSNSNTPVIAEVSRGSSSKKPAETRLAVVSRNSGVAPDDQIWSIETATQRLMELDMGGSSISEPIFVNGRTENPYRCVWKDCPRTSPPELQLPSGMDFYCPRHFRPGPEPDVWRMQCVGRTKLGPRCSLRDYRVLHPGVNADEYRCRFHWPTKRGLIFRTSPLYNSQQHLVSPSSSVGIARTLLRERELLSFIVRNARDSSYISITLNGWHRSVFSREQFDDLTQGFDNVLKENIRGLVVDYFRLLEASFHQNRRPVYSGSIISWRYQNDNRSDLITECLKRGSVYFLLYNIANLSCEKPVNSIAIKIGNTQELGQRADTHLAQCQIPIAKKIQFPEKGNIPFVYLLEEIVHEMLRAHQHDMVCPCNTTHTELYWFSGRQSHQENIFDAIVRTLGPIIHHWIAAIQNLHCLHLELQHAHLSTLLWNRQRAMVH